MNSTQKRIEAEKNGDKNGKVLCRLMNNAVYGKTMEKLRSMVNVKLVSNKTDQTKPSYMSHKIFDNDLVVIHENSVTLRLNKSACSGMCILELSKVLTCKFHYGYIKSKYGNNSIPLFTDTDS